MAPVLLELLRQPVARLHRPPSFPSVAVLRSVSPATRIDERNPLDVTGRLAHTRSVPAAHRWSAAIRRSRVSVCFSYVSVYFRAFPSATAAPLRVSPPALPRARGGRPAPD